MDSPNPRRHKEMPFGRAAEGGHEGPDGGGGRPQQGRGGGRRPGPPAGRTGRGPISEKGRQKGGKGETGGGERGEPVLSPHPRSPTGFLRAFLGLWRGHYRGRRTLAPAKTAKGRLSGPAREARKTAARPAWRQAGPAAADSSLRNRRGLNRPRAACQQAGQTHPQQDQRPGIGHRPHRRAAGPRRTHRVESGADVRQRRRA